MISSARPGARSSITSGAGFSRRGNRVDRTAARPCPGGEGTLRPDATALDIRLMLVAARASRQVEPDAWQRLLELMLDGLSATRRAVPRKR